MKTIEEKARAYDEAYKVAVELHNLCKEGTQTAFHRANLETMFPELAESEDEKIRKRLITDFGTIGKKEWGGLEVKDILAWLERQGDYANFRDKAQVGDRITKNEAGVLVNLSQLKKVAKPSEEQGEQKPQRMISAEAKEAMYDKPAAWSEEDEKNLRRAIRATKVVYPVAADWLKSFKDRMQPKQEWNEEDSIRLQRIIDFLWYNRKGDTDTICQQEQDIDWLKSLRHQNRWKPSDEQMEALKYVVNLMASSESPKENDYYYNVFKDLRKQLKKLMENSYESKNCTQNS